MNLIDKEKLQEQLIYAVNVKDWNSKDYFEYFEKLIDSQEVVEQSQLTEKERDYLVSILDRQISDCQYQLDGCKLFGDKSNCTVNGFSTMKFMSSLKKIKSKLDK